MGQYLELSNIRRRNRGILLKHIESKVLDLTSGRFSLKVRPPRRFEQFPNIKNCAIMAFQSQEDCDRVGELLNGSKIHGGWELSVMWKREGVDAVASKRRNDEKERLKEHPKLMHFRRNRKMEGKKKKKKKKGIVASMMTVSITDLK